MAITVGTPDHEAMRAASNLLAMPPLPRPLPPAPAAIESSGSSTPTSAISERRGIAPRIGRVQAVEIGQQHEQGSADVVRHERGEAVVVAVADLVGGDGVVLVDDRDGAEGEQPRQRAAGVEVLPAIDEVMRDEQRLGGHEAVRGEGVVPAAHQPRLPGGGDRLQRGDVGRPALEAEGGDAGGDGSRRHDDDVEAAGAQGGDLGSELA